MSSNNQLLIQAVRGNDPSTLHYELTEHNAETGKQLGPVLATSDHLKEIIKQAQYYQSENTVEYGLTFSF